MANKVLRLPAVIDRIGLAKSTIYLRIKEGTFPRPFNLGARSVGWLEADIEDWLERQIMSSHAQVQDGLTDGVRPKGCRYA